MSGLIKHNRRRFSSDNLFIGGLASLLPTAQDLELKFNIQAGNITNYKIIGDDISCRVTADYFTATGAFLGETNLTHYRDTEHCYLIYNDSFRSIPNDIPISFNEAIAVGFASFFASQISWDNLYLPKLTNFDVSSFNSMKNDSSTLRLPGAVKLPVKDALACFKSPSNTTKTVQMHNAIEILTTNMFHTFGGTFEAFKCTSLGDAATVLGIFTGILSTFRLYINVALKTINAGLPDADIMDAISNGATVYYTDNNGNIIP